MYVDAILAREKDLIHIVERVNGQRQYKDYPSNYIFYYPHENGQFRTIWGERCKRVSCRSSKEFRKEQAAFKGLTLYESDINPIFRCLADNYLGADAPELHVAFFDIETAWESFAYPETKKVKVRKKK
jgi:hypothetical protein